MNESKRLRIGVVGAGTMGRGIVQLFAQAGHDVLCFDEKAGAAATGIAAVVDALEKLAAKGRLSAADSRRHPQPNVDLPIPSDLARCDVVVEAVIEDLAVKRALFANLEQIVSPQAILATNTSSLGVAEIASACRESAARRGTSFLQSRAADEDRRGDRRCTHCASRRHDAARTGGAGRAQSGRRRRSARLPRQSRRARAVHGRSAHRRGMRRLARGRRRCAARGAGFPHGAVRAAGSDRPRRVLQGHDLHLRAVPGGAALPTLFARAAARRRRSLWQEERRRLVSLRERPEDRAAEIRAAGVARGPFALDRSFGARPCGPRGARPTSRSAPRRRSRARRRLSRPADRRRRNQRGAARLASTRLGASRSIRSRPSRNGAR